jgi:hypothetical protein
MPVKLEEGENGMSPLLLSLAGIGGKAFASTALVLRNKCAI